MRFGGAQRLGIGEVLILAGAGLMLLASFLPWYQVELILAKGSLNAWDEPGLVWSMLAVLISVALGYLVLRSALDRRRLADLPPHAMWPRAMAAAGVLPLVCVTLKLLTDSDFVAYGFYVAFLAGGLQAAGGVLVWRGGES